MDRASQVLAQGVLPSVPTSYRALADHYGNVSHSTLHHRARGRPSREEKAQGQQYLKLYEEEVIVKNHLLKSILQEDRIQFLTTINNKAKVRRSTTSLVLARAKVMSYEDLEEARAKRIVRDSAQATKGKRKRGRKSKSSPPEPEEDTAETARRGRKRKSAELEGPEPTNMSNAPKLASVLVMQASRTQSANNEIAPEQYRAPIARMY
ncbi:MAG: hypothetical protein M1818_000079 [Claussenomyces sp. TS43310]|nr:MAG: hypothetical protein M1818_000079 [Claussenomyces sp. TS43310]